MIAILISLIMVLAVALIYTVYALKTLREELKRAKQTLRSYKYFAGEERMP